MATTEIGSHSSELDEGTATADVERGEHTLREYAAETWDVPDDVVAESSITRVDEEICRKEITRRLRVDEELMVEEHSPSHHAQFDAESYFVDAPVDERAGIVPSSFEETVYRFLVPGSTERSNCSQCHSRGRITCSKCSGQGNSRCRSCRGTGTTTDSDGDKIRCSRCNGNGNRPCRRCDGAGDVTCGRCDGSGQTITFEYFERTFEPEVDVEIRSESVPEAYLEEPDGVHRETEQLAVDETTVKHSKEVRDIPVEVVEYEYDGSRYQIFDIEHQLVSPSHPRDRKKWAKLLGGVAGCLLLAAVVYVYVI